MTILLSHQIDTSIDGLPVYAVAALQPFVLETDQGLLEALVEAPLPVERVQTVPCDGGWQVMICRLDGEELLPTIYPDLYDAERKAAEIAIQLDISLICDDDPDGKWADDMINRWLYSAEQYDRATRWMY